MRESLKHNRLEQKSLLTITAKDSIFRNEYQ
jgi:hypothetical protein